jgi:hypothetical protein
MRVLVNEDDDDDDDDDDEALKTIARGQEQMLSTHRIVIIMMPLFHIHSLLFVHSLRRSSLT